MKLYIDTANLDEILYVKNNIGILHGVTTNPSLIAKNGLDFKETIIKICEIVKAPVSAEVNAETADEMLAQAKEFATWHEQIIIKLPITEAGILTCSKLKDLNIKTNLTLCFSVNQALMCARAGATYISPFVGRLDDIGENGIQLIEDIKTLYTTYNFSTEIIAASIRTAKHVELSALAGADIATIPYKVFKELLVHPLTQAGLEKFNNDWKQYKS